MLAGPYGREKKMNRHKPIYDEIRSRYLNKLEAGELEYCNDFEIEKDNGHRGYVLQISFENLLFEYEKFLSRFWIDEKDQIFVNRRNLHLTVFEFCSVRIDYLKYSKYIENFKQISKNILRESSPFTIDFTGTVFTSSSGIISGYDDDTLVDVRESIRNELKKCGIPILERYESQTAHISFMMFRKAFSDFSRFLETVNETRDMPIGKVVIDRMELVEHDWYNRYQTKAIIEEYELGKIS